MDKTIHIARLSDLAEGIPFGVHVEDVDLVVIKRDGNVAILQGACPHQGTLLAGGTVDKGALTCAGHGWRFDIATGRKVDDASICLTRFSAAVAGDRVGAQQDELRAWKQRMATQRTSSKSVRSLADLPGPRRLPLLGNLLQLDATQLHLILERWANKYGPIYTFSMGSRPVVAIAEPALIQEALRRRPEMYRRLSSIATVLREMGVNGVFGAEGTDWHRQRRVAMQALNVEHLRHFFPTLTTMTERLRNRWERAVAGGHTVDVQKDLMRYTVDVTTNLAFGHDMNALETDGDVLQHHLEHVLPMVNRRVNAPFPYWHFVKLPADRALDRALAGIRQAVADFIEQSRARLAQDSTLAAHPTNFLEAMLAARNEDGEAFTEEEIMGNALTMLVAGEDTTANSMAWMIYFLTQYPAVHGPMHMEVDTVLGHARILQHFHDHERLTYLDAVARETMRLKPVAPMIFLETNQSVELGGIRMPQGTALFLLTRQCGLQENAFTAAGQFKPERWLALPEACQGAHNPAAFMPFGAGPRFCPGSQLALLEIKAVMSMLCRNFSIVKEDGARQVSEQFAFTLMPTNLFVRFRAR
ncbi:MAG TPA: cytochrome P450 [Terriglobia bacterium]|nr:cytochrome P450 [Terriglobia bacterium]